MYKDIVINQTKLGGEVEGMCKFGEINYLFLIVGHLSCVFHLSVEAFWLKAQSNRDKELTPQILFEMDIKHAVFVAWQC